MRKCNWFHNHRKICNGQDWSHLSTNFLLFPVSSWSQFLCGTHSSLLLGCLPWPLQVGAGEARASVCQVKLDMGNGAAQVPASLGLVEALILRGG